MSYSKAKKKAMDKGNKHKPNNPDAQTVNLAGGADNSTKNFNSAMDNMDNKNKSMKAKRNHNNQFK